MSYLVTNDLSWNLQTHWSLLKTCDTHSDKAKFWCKLPDIEDDALQILSNKYMNQRRYERFFVALSISLNINTNDDFGQIRQIIPTFNDMMRKAFCSGYLNCLDESMMGKSQELFWMDYCNSQTHATVQWISHFGRWRDYDNVYIEIVEGKPSSIPTPFTLELRSQVKRELPYTENDWNGGIASH